MGILGFLASVLFWSILSAGVSFLIRERIAYNRAAEKAARELTALQNAQMRLLGLPGGQKTSCDLPKPLKDLLTDLHNRGNSATSRLDAALKRGNYWSNYADELYGDWRSYKLNKMGQDINKLKNTLDTVGTPRDAFWKQASATALRSAMVKAAVGLAGAAATILGLLPEIQELIESMEDARRAKEEYECPSSPSTQSVNDVLIMADEIKNNQNTNFLLPDDKVIETGDIQTLSDIIDWGIIDFEVPKLWNKNKGENINIMVCDTGITDHEDLKENIDHEKARSFVNGEDYIDHQGHGTCVAGVIAAKESGYGIVGVAPKSKIIPVKSLSNKGFANDLSLERSLRYALRVKPDIVNMSLGGKYPQSKIFHNLLKELYDLNIPVVCAMGNYGEKYSCFPADYPETIGVTSYKKNRNISDFSSRSDNADFALPGENILTTNLNNQYSIVNGTSFAAPFLSGLIAIILAEAKKKNIKYTIPQLKEILIKSCEDYGPAGKDNLFGYGIIKVEKLESLI